MRWRIFLFSAVFCIFSATASGQHKGTGIVHGGYDLGGDHDYPPFGAVITLCNQGDTLYTVPAHLQFTFKNCKPGRATIKFSHISYENYESEITIKADSVTIVTIKPVLKPMEEIEAAVVKSDRPPKVMVKGDTIIYNAAAVELMEGDDAIEILRNMPGVEVSESGIKIISEDVARTYVDGKLVFGDNVMSALNNLPADDVISIASYREESPFMTGRRHRKERVIDIKTKSKLVAATSGHALASAGCDTDAPHKFRYGAGITSNFFSEDLAFGLNTTLNNINRRSNRFADIASSSLQSQTENRLGYGELSFSKNWVKERYKDMVMLYSYYKYDNNHSSLQKSNTREYLAQDIMTSTGTDRRDSTASHSALVSVRVSKPEFGSLGVSAEGSLEDNYGWNSLVQNSTVSGVRQDATSTTESASARKSLHTQADYGTKEFGNIRGSVRFETDYASGTGYGFRSDVLDAGLSGIEYEDNSSQTKKNGTIRAGLEYYKPFDAGRILLSAAYEYSHVNQSSVRTSMDVTNPLLPLADMVNTYSYSLNYDYHTPSFIANLTKGRTGYSVWLRLQSAHTARTDIIPATVPFNRHFFDVLPSISVSNRGPAGGFSIKYDTSTMLPSDEQWRPYLNNSNPLRLNLGNSDLRPSYTHKLSANRSWLSQSGHFYSFSMDASITQNKIVYSTRYLKEDEYLSDWDYTARSGAALSQWVNGGVDARVKVWESTSLAVKSIGASVSIVPGVEYQSSPYQYDSQSYTRQSVAPELMVQANGNFKRKVQYKLDVTNAYSLTKCDELLSAVNKSYNLRVHAAVHYNFYKSLYVKGSYGGTLVTNSIGSLSSFGRNLLNCVLGASFFKKTLDVSVACYDMLGDRSKLASQVTANYVDNSFTNHTSRFITFNIGYKFYHSKSGLKQPASIGLSDGSISE